MVLKFVKMVRVSWLVRHKWIVISRSKRQTLVEILSFKHNNKVIFYGEGSEIVGDLFIDEFLNDERVNRNCYR